MEEFLQELKNLVGELRTIHDSKMLQVLELKAQAETHEYIAFKIRDMIDRFEQSQK